MSKRQPVKLNAEERQIFQHIFERHGVSKGAFRELLDAGASYHDAVRGDKIMVEGSREKLLAIFIDGTAAITIRRELDDGVTEEEEVAEIGDYGIVGEVALLRPDEYLASATVAVQSETLRVR